MVGAGWWVQEPVTSQADGTLASGFRLPTSDFQLLASGVWRLASDFHYSLASRRAANSVGTSVMSPAPIVRTRSPGSTNSASREARSARWGA